jgi:2-methylcitrate dehydratase PrpD
VLALAEKVVARRHPDWSRANAAAGGVVLIMADGGRHEMMVEQARGDPGQPMSDADLTAKFIACATRAEAPRDADAANALASRILSGGLEASAMTLLD